MASNQTAVADYEASQNDLGPLAWVLDELRKSLDGATRAMHRFVRDAELARGSELSELDTSHLRVARQQLHQAVGALEMVGMPAPAKLLHGMETLVQKYVQRPELCSDDAAHRIERASFAVSEYLEGLLKGKTASSVALFPQYRAVMELAGSERIHPADLWPLEWRWQPVTLPAGTQTLRYAPEVRGLLDQSVLMVVKTAHPKAAGRLAQVCAALSGGQQALEPRSFWAIAAAYFEAISLSLLPADIYTKRTASRILQQYATLARAESGPSERLAQDLVFFCAQAQAAPDQSAPLLAAVRAAYGLVDQRAVDYETEQFGRFDPAQLVLVRKRIAAAAETWSALAGGDTHRLKLTGDQFAAVTDSVLKLHPQSTVLAQALSGVIDATVRSGAAPLPAVAMEVATAILYLEAAYEDLDPTQDRMAERGERLAQRLQQVQAGAEPQPLEAWMEELYRRVSDRQTMGSVVDELRAALGEVEVALDQFFRNPTDKAPLREVPSRLAQMRGVFSVLGLDQPALACLRMRASVERLLVDEVDAELARKGVFEKLGNSLGALGLLIDMLSYQRAMAKKLFVYDEELGEFKPLMGRARTAVPEPQVPVSVPAPLVVAAVAATAAPAMGAAAPTPVPAPASAAPAVSAEDDDEDLRHIFLEEALEVVGNGLAAARQLAAEPGNLADQTTLRRAFHTLKGSARMVGLNAFGEAAWACEQMFNAWLAEQKPASDGLIKLSSAVLGAFGRWLADIASDQAADWRAAPFRASADAMRLHGEVLPLQLADTQAAQADITFEATAAIEAPVAPVPFLDAQAAARDFSDTHGARLRLDPLALAAAAALDAQTTQAMTTRLPAREPEEAPALDFELQPQAPDLPALDVAAEVPAEAEAEAEPEAPSALEVEAETVTEEALPTLVLDAEPHTAEDSPETLLPEPDAEDSPATLLFDPRAEDSPATLMFDPHAEDSPATQWFDPHADDSPATQLFDPHAEDSPETLLVLPEFDGETEATQHTQFLETGIEAEAEAAPLTQLIAPEPEAAPEHEPEPEPQAEEQLKVIGDLRLGIPLYNIFLNEADEWSRRLQVELSEWALELPRPLAQSTISLAHSLGGIAATVGFSALAELARTLEHALEHVHLHNQGTAQHAQVFSAAAEEIRRLLHQFAAGFLKTCDATVLQALKDIIDSTFAAPVLVPPHSDAVDHLDTDLFPIFQEETLELMPALATALRQWVARPDNMGARAEALRVLHTLKGSARLAGAMRLGEMAHRMESGVEQLGVEELQSAQLEPLLGELDDLQNTLDALDLAPREDISQAQTDAALVDEEGAEQPMAAAPAQPVAPAATTATAAAPAVPAAPVTLEQVTRQTPRNANAPSVRVRTLLLDRLLNQAGEVMISRSRLDARVVQMRSALGELGGNLERLRQQLRDVELQSESQMQSRLALTKDEAQKFDPLEFDRFTRVQELTRMMAESVNDVATVQRNLQRSVEGAEDDLNAQGRQARDLQRDLLRTRMVEFEGIAERLYGVVRQAAKEADKPVRLEIVGGNIEMDRGVLDRMTPAFEHILRNAVVHGIEKADARAAAGKPAQGKVTITVHQEGNDVSVTFNDDGGGLQLDKIRAKAIASKLIQPDAVLSEEAAAQLLFTPGFSTASEVTELSGRGIGMDVVLTELHALGGQVETHTETGVGTRFRLVLPLTTAVTQVVMLRMGDLSFGVPSNLIETVLRVQPDDVRAAYGRGLYPWAGQDIPFYWGGALLQVSGRSNEDPGRTQPVAVLRSAGQRLALHVDEVLGNREVVVKNLGPQLARLAGLAGMSVLASGAVVLIYNPVALAAVYGASARALTAGSMAPPSGSRPAPLTMGQAQAPLVLVVDDSITVRRVTQRLLKREGFRVSLANDGLHALEVLAQERPTVVLSDIEMPRMDGFDLVRNIRADEKLRDLPVIMITSRIAQKHRDHAVELGVDHYLGKPYAEEELLALIRSYCPDTVDG